jgi:hypothetical protein
MAREYKVEGLVDFTVRGGSSPLGRLAGVRDRRRSTRGPKDPLPFLRMSVLTSNVVFEDAGATGWALVEPVEIAA